MKYTQNFYTHIICKFKCKRKKIKYLTQWGLDHDKPYEMNPGYQKNFEVYNI